MEVPRQHALNELLDFDSLLVGTGVRDDAE